LETTIRTGPLGYPAVQCYAGAVLSNQLLISIIDDDRPFRESGCDIRISGRTCTHPVSGLYLWRLGCGNQSRARDVAHPRPTRRRVPRCRCPATTAAQGYPSGLHTRKTRGRVGTLISTFWILSSNSWMQTPKLSAYFDARLGMVRVAGRGMRKTGRGNIGEAVARRTRR
jgi:hypothetical protein